MLYHATLIKNQIFVDVFEIEDYQHLLIEGYVQGALWKELLIAPFVKHFKTTTLRKSHW